MSEWRTIDSAPKDGKFLVARFGPTNWEYRVETVVLYADDHPRLRETRLKYASHWQPLPAPPGE